MNGYSWKNRLQALPREKIPTGNRSKPFPGSWKCLFPWKGFSTLGNPIFLKKNSHFILQNVSISPIWDPLELPLSRICGIPRLFWTNFGLLSRLDPTWKETQISSTSELWEKFHFYFGVVELFWKRPLGSSSPKVSPLNPVREWIQDFPPPKISTASWAAFSMAFQPFW